MKLIELVGFLGKTMDGLIEESLTSWLGEKSIISSDLDFMEYINPYEEITTYYEFLLNEVDLSVTKGRVSAIHIVISKNKNGLYNEIDLERGGINKNTTKLDILNYFGNPESCGGGVRVRYFNYINEWFVYDIGRGKINIEFLPEETVHRVTLMSNEAYKSIIS